MNKFNQLLTKIKNTCIILRCLTIENNIDIKHLVQVSYFKYISTSNINNNNEIYEKYKYLFES